MGVDYMHISEDYRVQIQAEIDRLQNHVGKSKIQPQDIAVIRILQNILDEDQLPWEKSFVAPAVNVITKMQYSGINRWILPGGEYITFKQLVEYNKKNNKNFRISPVTDEDRGMTRLLKGSFPVVHYNVKPPREATEEEIKKHKAGKNVYGIYQDKDTGKFMIQPHATCSYFKVFNTIYIVDPDTGEAFPRLNIEKHNTLFTGEKIISEYKNLSGVKIIYDTPGRCFYSHNEDTIHMSPLDTFSRTKKNLDPVVEYYSTTFHEMGHSTGVEKRCNRECFKEWDGFGSLNYSMEECVAEMTATLLLSELKVDHNTIDRTIDNSASYIAGWLDFVLKRDKNDKYGKGAEKLIYAVRRAEKARNYIMSWFNECKSSS